MYIYDNTPLKSKKIDKIIPSATTNYIIPVSVSVITDRVQALNTWYLEPKIKYMSSLILYVHILFWVLNIMFLMLEDG